MKQLWVLGLGPGDPRYISPEVTRMISRCHVLMGGKRQLKAVDSQNVETITIKPPFKKMFPVIEGYMKQDRQVGIVVSGDPGFYSLLHTLLAHFSRESLRVFPGLGSLQYLFARAVIPWHDFVLKSLHGQSCEIVIQWAECHKKLALLTDPAFPFPVIAARLIEAGFGDRHVVIGERLSYTDERITEGNVKTLADYTSDPLTVVLLYEPEYNK